MSSLTFYVCPDTGEYLGWPFVLVGVFCFLVSRASLLGPAFNARGCRGASSGIIWWAFDWGGLRPMCLLIYLEECRVKLLIVAVVRVAGNAVAESGLVGDVAFMLR